jgi:hypothetical protein
LSKCELSDDDLAAIAVGAERACRVPDEPDEADLLPGKSELN